MGGEYTLAGRIADKCLQPRSRRLQKKISKLGIAIQSASEFDYREDEGIFEPATRRTANSGIMSRDFADCVSLLIFRGLFAVVGVGISTPVVVVAFRGMQIESV